MLRRILPIMAALAAAAQPPATNYDEAKVPRYTLPDPLALSREKTLALFEAQMYGKAPARPEKFAFELVEKSDAALGGAAIRKQYLLQGGMPATELLLYLPKSSNGRRAPVFLGMNFTGNASIHADPAIRETKSWMRQPAARGSGASRWPVEEILKRGYGVATVYYGDLDPDFDDGFTNGVHAIYGKPKADEWGAIAAWAWGLSRAMDVLVKDPQVDAERVAVHGHSRLGKAALWAGATDTRFSIVISNESGAGGAALSKRIWGETVENLNKRFPHWFAANFRQYNANEAALPFDQHQLLAAIAPRPLYICSAIEDQWADPRGEFLAALAADPVYRKLAGEGLPVKEMPNVDQPVMGRIGYHVRSGKHDVTLYDWERWMDFAGKWWASPSASPSGARKR